MESADPLGQDHRDRTPTLGDLLYANRARTPVAETAWLEMVHSIGRGDQLALHAFFEKTHRIVFTLSLRIVGHQAIAEEVTLDVFHDVWRRAVKYDPANGSVVGWLMNQTRSRAIDRLRYEQRKKRVNDADGTLAADGPRDPQETFDVSERGRQVRDALHALTPQERQAIGTAFFSELTYGEVAARLGQPIGTVKTRIRSGLAKLRQLLGGSLKDL